MTGLLGFAVLSIAILILGSTIGIEGGRNMIFSIALFLALPVSLYLWIDFGHALKSSKRFFIENGYGEYALYSEKEIELELDKTARIDKRNTILFNSSSVVFWVSFCCLILINFRARRAAAKFKAG